MQHAVVSCGKIDLLVLVRAREKRGSVVYMANLPASCSTYLCCQVANADGGGRREEVEGGGEGLSGG